MSNQDKKFVMILDGIRVLYGNTMSKEDLAECFLTAMLGNSDVKWAIDRATFAYRLKFDRGVDN